MPHAANVTGIEPAACSAAPAAHRFLPFWLPVSFEHVIRDADVSRSAVYRRWPYKDLFFSDLVKELAKDATPPAIVSDEVDLIRQIVAERLDWLGTPGGRHRLMLELFRQLSPLDFQALYRSPQWRTYLALHATFLSLADGALSSLSLPDA